MFSWVLLEAASAAVLAAPAEAIAFFRNHVRLGSLLAVFGIKSRRAATSGFERQAVPVGHFVKERIRAGKVIGDDTGPDNLGDGLTKVPAHALAGIENPGLAAHQFLFEEDRVGDHGGH